MFEDDPPPPASIDRPPDNIDPDSIPGRLTLIEERLKAMSVELDSLRAISARTARRRHRSITRWQNRENVVKFGLAVALMFVLALFLLYAELAPSPTATVVPPAAPPAGPSNTAEPETPAA
jgi:hypothetical protein